MTLAKLSPRIAAVIAANQAATLRANANRLSAPQGRALIHLLSCGAQRMHRSIFGSLQASPATWIGMATARALVGAGLANISDRALTLTPRGRRYAEALMKETSQSWLA